MITKMKKLTFLVFKREYDNFLERMRSLGVVHVIQKQQGAVQNAALQENIQAMTRLKTVLKELESVAPVDGRKAEPSGMTAESVMERYDSLVGSRTANEQALQALSRNRQVLVSWGDFDPVKVSLLEKAGYSIKFFTCPLKSFDPAWESEYNAVEIEKDKQKVNFVTISSVGKNVDIDAEVCNLPETSLSEIDSRIAELNEANSSVCAELSELAAGSAEVLKSEIDKLQNEIDFGRVRLNGEEMADGMLLLLEGWVPAAKAEETGKQLDQTGIFYQVSDPQSDDDIPIQLSNNKFAKLFEPLTRLYMLPSYEELDLTLMFAPFFMLFFGLCLGDMGYGMLMIIGLPIFTKLFKLINPDFSKGLVILFGISTILCGLLSGTFFGFNIYDLDIEFVKKMKDILFVDNSTMFTVSLCIGVVQILFGMAVKAVNLTIQCGFKHALSTLGWLLLLITVGVCALAGISFSNPVVMVLLGIAAVGIFLLNSPGKNPLLNIGLGLWDTYNMATGLLGDVLSYVRLFALGLSGGILASVFNNMATGMSPDVPVVGFLVTALIFVAGHALNIFMNILGAVVHPMRLTFVEFFKNAGYAGGGTEYRPFGGSVGSKE